MRDSEDDIRADIAAAIGGAEAPAPVPTTGDAPGAEPFAPPAADAPAVARDETGKFAKKETLATPEKPAQSAPVTPVAAPESPGETIQPPHSLKAAVKAAWDTYPIELRQELVRIEQDAQKGKTEWQSKGERLNKIDAVIEPIRHRLQLTGVDEVAYIAALSSADARLRGPDKEAALAELAQFYGITLPSGRQPEQQQLQQPQQMVDPQVQALMQEVNSLKHAQTQQQQREAQAEEQRQANEGAALQGEVDKFRQENIYFDNVKDSMANLLRSREANDLKDAYDQACWKNPEIRLLLQAPAPKPAASSPAKPAVLSVVGPTGEKAKTPATPAGLHADIEDDVRNAIMEVQRRA